jgi:hypothetical protein
MPLQPTSGGQVGVERVSSAPLAAERRSLDG